MMNQGICNGRAIGILNAHPGNPQPARDYIKNDAPKEYKEGAGSACKTYLDIQERINAIEAKKNQA